jgi:signal transduction histidine kinase
VKHAQAKTVFLNMKKAKSKLLVNIFDNGIGFNPLLVKKGAGLKSIQNRVYLANGSLQIKSMPGKGCKISITFPLKNSNILKQHG